MTWRGWAGQFFENSFPTKPRAVDRRRHRRRRGVSYYGRQADRYRDALK